MAAVKATKRYHKHTVSAGIISRQILVLENISEFDQCNSLVSFSYSLLAHTEKQSINDKNRNLRRFFLHCGEEFGSEEPFILIFLESGEKVTYLEDIPIGVDRIFVSKT
jgi:hypothetical protein